MMDEVHRAIQFGAYHADMPHKLAHVDVVILVTTGQGARQSVDDEQHTFLAVYLLGFAYERDQFLGVIGPVKQIDRARHESEGDFFQIIDHVVLLTPRPDAEAHADAAFGRDIDHEALLDLTPKVVAPERDVHTHVEHDEALA